MQLSAGASLQIGEQLTLRPALRSKAPPVDDNNVYLLFEPPTSQSLAVTAVAVPVRAVLEAPLAMGSCSDLVASAARSQGSLGRPWRVSWAVEAAAFAPHGQVSALISAAASASAQNMLQLRVSATDIDPGTAFALTVVVTNALGSSDRTTANITKASSVPLHVEVVGGRQIEVSRAEVVVLRARALLRTCDQSTFPGEDDGRRRVEFSWHLERGPSEPALPGWARSGELRIPAFSLSAGAVYVIAVTATWRGATASSTVTLTVRASPLVAILAGGSRAVAAGVPLVVSTRGSFDPDSAVDALGSRGRPLFAKWSCSTGDGQPCFEQLHQDPTLASLGGSLELPGSALTSGRTLKLRATLLLLSRADEVLLRSLVGDTDLSGHVENSGAALALEAAADSAEKQAIVETTVEVVQGAPLAVTIRSSGDGMKVPSGSRVSLTAEIDPASLASLTSAEWTTGAGDALRQQDFATPLNVRARNIAGRRGTGRLTLPTWLASCLRSPSAAVNRLPPRIAGAWSHVHLST